MLKAVVFDYGGAISDGGRAGSVRNLLIEAGVLQADASDNLTQQLIPDFTALKLGKIDEATLFSSICRKLGVQGDLQEFLATWTKYIERDFQPAPLMLDLVKNLQRKQIQTGLLSNTFPLTARIQRQHGWYKPFEPCILSCEVGLAKPDPAIYKLTLEQLAVPAAEVLYIDDKQTCLDPAEELGMKTLLAKNSTEVYEAVLSQL